MRTYYELLSIANNADANTIKTAFRREIARYHPDKVTHLGSEFQELAAMRAAALTVAYKTLTDEALRTAYDASLADGVPTPNVDSPRPDEPTAAPPPPLADDVADVHTAPSSSGRARFEPERAGRDIILRRAMTARVRSVVEGLLGPLTTPTVRGFDAAFVPTAKPRLLGTALPRVLVKVMDTVDAAALNEGWANASRARVHAGKSPVVVLLVGKHIAPQHVLSLAVEALTRQPRASDGPHEIALIAIDAADWSCRLPVDISSGVRKIIERICR